MKLGFGFYRHMLDADNLAFARQAGATHAVVHLVDYFRQGNPAPIRGPISPPGDHGGWGFRGRSLRALDAAGTARNQTAHRGRGIGLGRRSKILIRRIGMTCFWTGHAKRRSSKA